MMEFVTDPVVIILGPDRFKLAEDYIVKCYDYTIIVPAEFESDLDTVPRIPFAYMLLKNRCPRAAILHDALYRFKPYGLTRLQYDQIFLCAMEIEGLGSVARNMIYAGVRLGGASHF